MEKRNDYVEVESNINPYAGDKSAVEVDRTAMDAMDGGDGNGYADVKSDGERLQKLAFKNCRYLWLNFRRY